MRKIVSCLALVSLTMLSCKENKKSEENQDVASEMETKKEVKTENEWEFLFDGKDFSAWHMYNGGEVSEAWTIEGDAMVLTPGDNAGNIVTNEEFENFVLSLEWKISEGGNSGIFWGVQEGENYGQPYKTGPEIQVLDNERHPDAKNGTTHQAGALYDMIAPSEDVAKPAGEWNTCVIKIDHTSNHGEVTLNGTKIVEFPVHGDKWKEMIANSKFKDWEGFGAFQKGKIGLQYHGDKVYFRNIKIKEL
ncbi:3-keto-disaccharide hydrolase [Galbibacter mesophilus]|uniref:3-keto-disaccharide hydrolase n=1 Tax=Galbibacter mesophilus TaxID=379069 RepID=UPI00191ED0B5|nr:DUF1080 domain-containing protein [Galbibacter mesophilus]MCM5662556.1 DUF1080 domain-containing protein [Galbibacter mesophilus]